MSRRVCPKCTDILVAPPFDLLLFTPFWKPGLDDAEMRRLGEAVRVEAIALHTQAGHPLDPKEYPSRPWWKRWLP